MKKIFDQAALCILGMVFLLQPVFAAEKVRSPEEALDEMVLAEIARAMETVRAAERALTEQSMNGDKAAPVKAEPAPVGPAPAVTEPPRVKSAASPMSVEPVVGIVSVPSGLPPEDLKPANETVVLPAAEALEPSLAAAPASPAVPAKPEPAFTPPATLSAAAALTAPAPAVAPVVVPESVPESAPASAPVSVPVSVPVVTPAATPASVSTPAPAATSVNASVTPSPAAPVQASVASPASEEALPAPAAPAPMRVYLHSVSNGASLELEGRLRDLNDALAAAHLKIKELSAGPVRAGRLGELQRKALAYEAAHVHMTIKEAELEGLKQSLVQAQGNSRGLVLELERMAGVTNDMGRIIAKLEKEKKDIQSTLDLIRMGKYEYYEVREGDTCESIATQPRIYGDRAKHVLIRQANSGSVPNLDRLTPGQILVIPRFPASGRYEF